MAISESTRGIFDLGGRVAVVTGGNRGIGRAIAIALAQAGAAIAILARDEAKNREALADLRALGVPALALKVDLMKRADLKPAMDEVERALGPVDVLVNNAAFAILKGVLDQQATAAAAPMAGGPTAMVKAVIDQTTELDRDFHLIFQTRDGWLGSDSLVIRVLPIRAALRKCRHPHASTRR
jgi:NAD(P)-dependent dehydrogenase (short-subunit alcohol dehydrogenase family)